MKRLGQTETWSQPRFRPDSTSEFIRTNRPDSRFSVDISLACLEVRQVIALVVEAVDVDVDVDVDVNKDARLKRLCYLDFQTR